MKKSKDCQIGWECGNACISKTKNCPSEKGEDISNNISLVATLITGLSSSGSKSSREDLNNYFAQLPEEEREIWSVNEGIFSDLAAAMGIQAYFGSEYPEINKYFYDEEYRKEAPEDIKMKAEAAILGFEELPELDKEKLQEEYAKIGVNYDGKHVYRGMTFGSQDALESFLADHKEGEDITYEAFTSTSIANPEDSAGQLDGGWGKKPVQIVIEQREDSAGKHVDDRKRSKNEGEILYKPGTTFEVDRIESDEREKLPDRLGKPIESIFTSSEDGGGVKNLPVKTLLGEKSPEAILNDPNYAWFKDMLKKRGLPDISEWDNLTFGDIFSIGKMKGGKFFIANEIINALQDQVKDNERTGIIEHTNVKIYLKEK